jgi:hypothetical protein
MADSQGRLPVFFANPSYSEFTRPTVVVQKSESTVHIDQSKGLA